MRPLTGATSSWWSPVMCQTWWIQTEAPGISQALTLSQVSCRQYLMWCLVTDEETKAQKGDSLPQIHGATKWQVELKLRCVWSLNDTFKIYYRSTFPVWGTHRYVCTKFISRVHSSPLLQSLNRHMDLSWGKKIPLLMAQMVKNLPAMQETQVQFLGWEDPPGEGNGSPLWYSFPGEFHWQRSLAGYSPWGRRE